MEKHITVNVCCVVFAIMFLAVGSWWSAINIDLNTSPYLEPMYKAHAFLCLSKWMENESRLFYPRQGSRVRGIALLDLCRNVFILSLMQNFNSCKPNSTWKLWISSQMRGKLTSFSEVNANISLLISLCYLNYLLDVLVISTLNLKWGKEVSGGLKWAVYMK